MAKIENIVSEKFVIARAVDMTRHVLPACVVHEVEVGKFRVIGRLLTHPHPDESKLFRHRICPGDRRLRHDTVTVRVEDALTIRSEAQAVIRALQLVGNDLTLGQWGEPVRTHVSQDVKSSIRSTVEGKRFFDDFPTKWLVADFVAPSHRVPSVA